MNTFSILIIVMLKMKHEFIQNIFKNKLDVENNKGPVFIQKLKLHKKI